MIKLKGLNFKILIFLFISLFTNFLIIAISYQYDYAILFAIICLCFYFLIYFLFPYLYQLKFFLPTSIYLTSYIIIIFLPSFFIYYINRGETYVTKYLIGVSSVLLFIPIGVFLCNIFFKINLEENINLKTNIIENHIKIKKFIVINVCLTILSIIIFIFYLKVTPKIPLLEIFRNPHSFRYLMSLREEALKLLQINKIFIYIFRWLRTIVFPVITMIWYFIYRNTKNKIYMMLFIFILILGMVFAMLNLEKIPIISFLLSIGFFLFMLNRERIKTILIFASLLFIIPLLIVYFTNVLELGIVGSIKELFNRIFYIPSYTIYQYFEVFPRIMNFLYGKSISWYANLLNKEFFNAANFVYKIYYPERLESGLVNTCFVGDAYANFGFMGIVIQALILGILLNLYNFLYLNFFSKKEANIYSIIFISLLFPILIIDLNQASLTTAHLTHGIIPLIFLLTLLKIMIR